MEYNVAHSITSPKTRGGKFPSINLIGFNSLDRIEKIRIKKWGNFIWLYLSLLGLVGVFDWKNFSFQVGLCKRHLYDRGFYVV